MAREWDVVVVGGGLAGRMAALAASDAGASVHVVAESEDALRHSSGLIDLLGYVPGTDEPTARPFEHLSDVAVDFEHLSDVAVDFEHPYSVLGESTVRDALRLLESSVGDDFVGLSTDRNALVVGPLGIPLVAFAYPAAVDDGLISESGDLLLVDVDPLEDFDATLAAANLERTDPNFDVGSASIDLTPAIGSRIDRLELARRLDREVSIAAGDRTVLPALVDALLETAPKYDRIGLPAALGVDRAPEIRRTVAERIGGSVFEIPTGPPSVLAIRLDRALDEAVSGTDALLTEGPRAVDYRVAGGRIVAVEIDRDRATEWIRGRQFVLATGGFVGGGLRSTGDTVVEPLFGCPVNAPPDPHVWTATGPFESQSFARVGVTMDGQLRPLDGDRNPRYANLRAAGDVLGGFDPVSEGSAVGVAVATGYAAGTWAAREVRA